DTEIFVSNQTFWEPGSTGATSAVCWNAGVLCEGAAPGPYTDCRVADFDTSGQLLDPGDPSTDEDAALIPVKRFIDTLQGIENTKKSINQDHEVLVSVIGGVPPGYASGDAEILYLDSSNLDEQILFGIGPGCTTADGGVGLPPVRLREFAESFAVGADRNLHSICGSDYTAALTSLADRIRDQLGASCLPVCAGDTDPQTPVLDPYCLVEQEVGGDLIAIPECVADPNSGYSLPDAAELCFYYLRDSDNLTPTPDDDLSPKCADEGWNLEFGFVRAGGTPMPSQVRASCELSELPSVDCPDLY
ncbi:MAG: VWA domain-containing protein, partial [Myxococcales bacterium]|nr:VWA domain-containing protein [Myxococcales bacterium]